MKTTHGPNGLLHPLIAHTARHNTFHGGETDKENRRGENDEERKNEKRRKKKEKRKEKRSNPTM